MKPKGISREEVAKIAAQHGATILPPEHPVYSEGPSIIFLSSTQKSSRLKAIDLPNRESAADSDSADPS
jgi:hypothetical protein